MMVIKCDISKKQIKDKDKELTLGYGWQRFSLCSECSQPVLRFFKKQKLIEAGRK